MKLFRIFILLLILIFMTDSTFNKFEFFAFKYGNSVFPENNIFYKSNSDKSVNFDWLFYVIKTGNKIILVDTGFADERYAKIFNINFKNPVKLLKEIKIEPENITDVIITHGHFDHIGNIDKFKNAKIYIQHDELQEQLNKPTGKYKNFLKGNPSVIPFVDSATLYDKITITKIGGHTIGSSVVSFNYKNKDYLIVGDEFYLLENIKQSIPNATFYDINKNKSFMEKISSKNFIIFTMHDPAIVTNGNYRQILP